VAFTLTDLNNETQLRRKMLLTPCASKDGLRRWFRFYLGLDFPDTLIDDTSTGSPMDVFWRVYNAGVTCDPDFTRRVMMYASRDSFKTLGASALELMAMLHMNRSVVHMAAIEQQACKAQDYVRGFLDRDELSEFVVGNNKRTLAVCWFEHKPTGNILTLDEWKALGGRSLRGQYIRHSYYIKVIVNTPQSANSDHVAFMVVDELDLVRFPKAYHESILIPSTQTYVYGRKQPPITLLTSTRKSTGGLVQFELDRAKETGMRVEHWSIFDVTGACPESRHRPDLPKLKVYRSDETLKTITPEEYAALKVADPKKAETYVEAEAFKGCIENCPIFAACRGRLAAQKSKCKLLKEVDDTIGKFREVSVEMAKAQLLCWKPGNEGAIYATLSRETHMMTPRAMYRAITGEEAPAAMVVTKDMLVQVLRQRGMPCVAGIDFGYTHCFAVVVGWVVGRILYILEAFEIPELEPHQCVEVCDRRIKKWSPLCWPDTAYPAYIKMFRSNGYSCREHTKDVIGGIEAVRKKLMPASSRKPELYLLDSDNGCDLLAKRILAYKWKMDTAGRPTDVPDDKEDDLDDALRYLVQNTFEKSGRIVVPHTTPDEKQPLPGEPVKVPSVVEQMQAKIAELLGTGDGVTSLPSQRKIRKGGFFCDFS
jgi:hypothetical protein